MLKILVVDKSPFFREGVLRILQKLYYDADVQVRGTQEFRLGGWEQVMEFNILIVTPIVSVDFGDFVSHLSTRSTGLKVIVISEQIYQANAKYWFSKGASGYLSRDVDPDVMSKAINTVLENRHYIEASMLIRFIAMEKNPWSMFPIALSVRESQIMEFLLTGLRIEEISEKLKIGARAVANHRARIFRKLNVHDIEELERMYPR